jgi:hypothetical protein
MIGFEVSLNGKRLFTASTGETGVLTAAVTWVLRTAAGVKEPSDVRLEIGGLANDTHMRWASPRKLAIGDEVLVRVVETSQADPPARIERDGPGFVESEERKYYEKLKAKYKGK